ncbi:Hypothetical_protein [Hexamita inflata]|uniref:Hypothetical_protein n=1 Tax=Hexamita inflata TaxID=28002 RepID=A0AA86PFQ0_9EUKA|nr:Hypothetical protein HINF_LOCUS22537 [Hexamita inflata]
MTLQNITKHQPYVIQPFIIAVSSLNDKFLKNETVSTRRMCQSLFISTETTIQNFRANPKLSTDIQKSLFQAIFCFKQCQTSQTLLDSFSVSRQDRIIWSLILIPYYTQKVAFSLIRGQVNSLTRGLDMKLPPCSE